MNMTLVGILALAAVPTTPGHLGHIAFKVTGSPTCQRQFTDGMLALYSFMYEGAHAAFQKAGEDCAMARWGDAMAYSHPIWGEMDAEKARAAIAKIKNESQLPAREKAFVGAARALFGPGNQAEGLRAWLAATEAMFHEFPGDDEVALEYALALLAPVNNDHFRNTKRLMESAAIALDVFHRHPDHPGAAHYVIHACDSPDHAILALPAARQYAKIAPAASHALHMPSHTFVQLGLWSDVAASNEASWGVNDARRPLARYDLHSYSWLVAAYLELGQVKRAEKLVSDLKGWLEKEDSAGPRMSYANVVRYFVRDTTRWDELDTWLAPLGKRMPLEAGEPEGSLGCGLHAPGAAGPTRPPFGLFAEMNRLELMAEASMRKGDEASTRKHFDAIDALMPGFEPWKATMPADFRERLARERTAMTAGAHAFATRAPGDWQRAIEAFREYADRAESYGPSGPAFDVPERQLLAELELAAGHAKDALADFDKVLDLHPMLSLALLGAGRSARAAGDAEAARDRYAKLLKLWGHADPELPALPEARAGAEVASVR